MAKNTIGRPAIETIASGAELKRWYWLKAELEAEAKRVGVKTTGGKFTILDRLMHHRDTGEVTWPGDKKTKVRSKFDWHCEVIDLDTVITDSYKNSQNVRRFFKAHVGENFKFNTTFMAWMKANVSKTMADAVAEYQRQKKEMSDPGFKSDILHHNQFNQYTRDFLEDNPDMGMKDVRYFWALKRALPSETGRHIYERSDLELGGYG